MRGVSQVRSSIGERDALGLGQHMQVVGAVVAHRVDVVALEDVQHLERDEPLRVRRHP